MWRILRWVVLAVVVLIVVAVALPFFLPTSVYKAQIIEQAKLATGRELKIDGDLKISIFPTLGVEVNKVRFANVAGAAEPDMVTMETLVAGAELWPLLSGSLQVTQVKFVDPVIHLEIDKNGRGNWLFEPERPGAAGAPNETAPPPPPSSTSSADFSFRDVALTGGVLTYRDARDGTDQRVEAINANVKLPSLDEALEFDGGLTWNKEAIKIVAAIANPRALSTGKKSALRAKVEGEVLNASFDGSVDAADSAIEGKVDFATASARRLAAWAGVELPKVQGFGAMKLTGEMASGADYVAFKNAKLSLDGMNGSGNLRLDTGKATPHVKGDFTLDRLDLNPYMGSGAGGPAKSGGGSSGWSDAPIDFSALKLVDADFAFAVNAFTISEMKIGRSALAIVLAGGKLKANLKEMALYGGAGTGVIELDGSAETPRVALDIAVGGVQAQPFLTDAVGLTRLSGTGGIVAKLASAGRSERQWMRGLGGAAKVKFEDGAIRGIDLAQVARTIEAALSGTAIGAGAKTDFAELSGSFVVRGGIAANKDLRLLNPFVRLNGAGLVDIGSRTLDYRVEPKAVSSRQGQGGAFDLGGIGIPFRIKGPWSNPSYAPDLSGVMSSTLDSILKGGNPLDSLKGTGDDIGGLLGIGGTQQEGADGKKGDKKKKPKDEDPLDKLKGLFGN
jgi:AsmA protein